MSVRLAVAEQQGFDESMAEKVERYASSDLSERHKVALSVADALMTSPGDIGRDLRDAARAYFDDDELIELTLDVMKWNTQKVVVSLGMDAEVAAGQLTGLEYDSDGRPSFASRPT